MKIVVVGCGSIGVRHLRNLRELGAGDVRAVDVERTRAELAARTTGVRFFATLQGALDWRPDAAVICTPTHTHLETARQYLAAGAHVLIEKPVSHSMDGTRAFAEFAATVDRVVLVACNMRFHPGVRTVREVVETRRIGTPQVVRAHFAHYLPNWRPGCDYRQSYSAQAAHGGGVILEGIHELDYVRLLAGDAVSVVAAGGRFGALQLDGEDTATLAIHTTRGAYAEIHLDCLQPVKSRGATVIGSEGTVRWHSDGRNPERVVVEWSNVDGSEREELLRHDGYDGNEMYRQELQHFMSCVESGAPPEQDLASAMRVLEVAVAAQAQLWARQPTPVT